jgi:hypothetical protein
VAASESFLTYRNRRLFAPSRVLRGVMPSEILMVVLAVGLPLHGSRADRRMWPRDSDLSKLSKPKAGAQLLNDSTGHQEASRFSAGRP